MIFLSVGGCLLDSRLTKLFLRIALSMACYRSYRDSGSQQLAMAINPHAGGPVVPDLAFSLPLTHYPLKVKADDNRVQVGVSPIAYAHSHLWPIQDSAKYEQYMVQLGSFVSSLLRGEISVTLFSSSNPDEQIFKDLRNHLDPALEKEELGRLSSRYVESLQDLIVFLHSVDFVVASRLHGLLLSLLSGNPSLAISYDRKVRTLMNDLDQAAYCLEISSLCSETLLETFSRLQENAHIIPQKLQTILANYNRLLENQYTLVAQIISHELNSPRQVPTSQSIKDRSYGDGSEVDRLS
ncbi:MAG: hypothetical protein NVS9B5_27470 [Terriglobales bacterium]